MRENFGYRGASSHCKYPSRWVAFTPHKRETVYFIK